MRLGTALVKSWLWLDRKPRTGLTHAHEAVVSPMPVERDPIVAGQG